MKQEIRFMHLSFYVSKTVYEANKIRQESTIRKVYIHTHVVKLDNIKRYYNQKHKEFAPESN